MSCLNHVFNCKLKDTQIDIADTNEEAISKCVEEYLPCASHMTRAELCRVMQTQIYMSLKINYPYYSWPRHVFGVFEGLVMRRVQLNEERSRPKDRP